MLRRSECVNWFVGSPVEEVVGRNPVAEDRRLGRWGTSHHGRQPGRGIERLCRTGYAFVAEWGYTVDRARFAGALACWDPLGEWS